MDHYSEWEGEGAEGSCTATATGKSVIYIHPEGREEHTSSVLLTYLATLKVGSPNYAKANSHPSSSRRLPKAYVVAYTVQRTCMECEVASIKPFGESPVS